MLFVQIYYVFGFLFLVLLILVVTCAEISIVMCYFQLCSEVGHGDVDVISRAVCNQLLAQDYNWWWRSFLTSGSSALYLFAYAIVYFVTKVI
jgi:transmembrane 9 superfamily protein 2/4